MDKAGEALGWLGMAKSSLEEVQGKTAGLKNLKIGKGRSAGKGRKGKVAEELDSVAAFASAYKKVNDTVRRHRVVLATRTPLILISTGLLPTRRFGRQPPPASPSGSSSSRHQALRRPYTSFPPSSRRYSSSNPSARRRLGPRCLWSQPRRRQLG